MASLQPQKPSYHCLRCLSDWLPRVAQPKQCPRCGSPYWNSPRREAADTEGEGSLPTPTQQGALSSTDALQ